MEIQFLVLHLVIGNIAIYLLDFAHVHVYFAHVHVVVVDDKDDTSVKVESLRSLNSYILIILGLLYSAKRNQTKSNETKPDFKPGSTSMIVISFLLSNM